MEGGGILYDFRVNATPSQLSVANESQSTLSTPIDLEATQDDVPQGDTKRKRKKTSVVWEAFKEVVVKDGSKKAECVHCQSKLGINPKGATSHLHAHLLKCTSRKLVAHGQKVLAFGPSKASAKVASRTNYKYDNDHIRELFAKAIIVHEYPFAIVEHEFHNQLLKALNPLYESISRTTVKSDVMKVVEMEKKKLKETLQSIDRICLTMDMWTSNQTIGYMSLIGHFIDSEWNLQHVILNFREVDPPHTGIIVADAITECLTDWGINDKVFTITLDNASVNDVIVRTLMGRFKVARTLFFEGKIFHVRCCAHIVNLIVQDGLNEIKDVIENVRMSVKYIKSSPSRLHKFKQVAEGLQLPTLKGLSLDVCTRWDSTYLMLESALYYKEVFTWYGDQDSCYIWRPCEEEWKRAEEVCQFLKVFYEITNCFSGKKYPTSNLFLPQVWRIKAILNEKITSTSDFVQTMARKMKDKFDIYWGTCCLLMSISTALDPRFKIKFIDYCFRKVYSHDEASHQITILREAVYELFNGYVIENSIVRQERNGSQVGSSFDTCMASSSEEDPWCKGVDEFDLLLDQTHDVQQEKSELDIYFEDGIIRVARESKSSFDALGWWKHNALKYPVLSKMARDILTVPISTVASESAFNSGARVISDYRSSLTSEIVEALICGGDWLRNSNKIENKFDLEDNFQGLQLS